MASPASPRTSSASATDAGLACPSRGRAVDLVHLAAQTQGESALEQEILGLMLQQIDSLEARLGSAGPDERRHIAHALKGAARNVGAFALAERAQALEHDSTRADVVHHLEREMRRTAAFIRTLLV